MHHSHTLETSLEIRDNSQIAAARRFAVRTADEAGLDADSAARVALIVSEAGSNMLKYGGGGVVTLARPIAGGALDIMALDQGAGVADVSRCLRDGHSTGGSLGIGLGAIKRAASLFDMFSAPGKGVALFAQVRPARVPAPEAGSLRVGSRQTAYAGETVSGDAWSSRVVGTTWWFTVIDGLGHGPHAATAARLAVRSFNESPQSSSPADVLRGAHAALQGSRGAVMAVAMIDTRDASLRFAGVGNIACMTHDGEHGRHLISHDGMVGYGVWQPRESRHAWHAHATLLMHSDGLSSRCNPTRYPGLLQRHPALIAGVLHRDFGRHNDDATVLVIQGS